MAHEEARPNKTLSGTAIPAVISVNLIAARVSGSTIELPNSFQPSAKAFEKTSTSGTTRKKARKTSAIKMNSQRTGQDSVVAREAAPPSPFPKRLIAEAIFAVLR